MAEEELAPKEGLEPNAVSEAEPNDKPDPSTDDADDPIAKLALDLGWTPKDQFTGDPDKWKPAEQFIRDGREIQRSMSRELREVKDTVANMSRVSQTLMEQQIAERDAYWQAKQDEAFEAGDKDGFTAAARERDKLAKTAKPVNGEPSEVQEFRQRNKWYESDPLATAFAVNLSAQNASLPVPEQLRIVETEVRKRFPEHFPAPAKQPPAVNQPAARGAGRSSGKGFNDMPPEAQKMAIHLEETRGVSRDRYVASWFKQQEKVG